jgi:hypothetical protein
VWHSKVIHGSLLNCNEPLSSINSPLTPFCLWLCCRKRDLIVWCKCLIQGGVTQEISGGINQRIISYCSPEISCRRQDKKKRKRVLLLSIPICANPSILSSLWLLFYLVSRAILAKEKKKRKIFNEKRRLISNPPGQNSVNTPHFSQANLFR